MEKYKGDSEFHTLNETLSKLTKIDAPLSFEEDLFNKIRDYDSVNFGFLKKIYSFSMISPVAGSVVLSLLFVIILSFSSTNGSDPFFTELLPRFDTIRKVIIDYNSSNNSEKIPNSITQREKILQREKAIEPEINKSSGVSSVKVLSSIQNIRQVSDSLYVYYSGQKNYRIVYLTSEEKNQLDKVKNRIFSQIM